MSVKRHSNIVRLALTIASAMALPASAQDPSPRKLASRADEAMAAGEYGRALEAYRQLEAVLSATDEDAATDAGERPRGLAQLAYNRGVAQYRLNRIEQAAESFREALVHADPELEAKARYNLGNCAFARAQANEADVQAAIDQLSEAISQYREAIRANPADEDARANIELANRLRRQLLEQQQQEQQDQQNDEEPNDDEKQEGEQKQQSPSSQPESQPASQPSEQQQNQDQESPEQQEQNGSQQQEDQQAEQQQADQQQAEESQSGEPSEEANEPPAEARPAEQKEYYMTVEQARRLLQAVRDKERQRRRQELRQLQVEQQPVEKDW